MIFLILALLLLAFVAIWNFDLHKIVYVKSLSQNAGDGASLAAARWQAITLNLIGDLNVMQAVAIMKSDTNAAAEIAELEARLCYVGPMVGCMAAQQAAKNNGIFNNERFTQKMMDHAGEVRNDYTAIGPGGTMLFPEPYPGCWGEYADMIETIAMDGVAAGPDNAKFYTDYTGGHILLDLDFYDAVAGEDWCWFYHHAYNLLLTYSDYHDWPPLPPRLPRANPMNSEYFGLGLKKVAMLAGPGGTAAEMDKVRQDRTLSPTAIGAGIGGVPSAWYCYDGTWGPWDAMSATGPAGFPVAGDVKKQYDYAGADAAVRVLAEASRLTPGSSGSPITWTAAAKPFGYLNDEDKPNAYDIVLPAYRDIRLIPIDASSAPAGGAFNLDWRDHIEGHLPDYMQNGPSALKPGCWYCAQLTTWENPVFRQTGKDWLALHSAECNTGGGGGGGTRGGGTRRGH